MITTLKKHAHRLELTVIAILIASLALTLSQGGGLSTITGFVATETQRQTLGITITESSILTIQAVDGTPPRITSFALTGTIAGNGTAAIYLENHHGQRRLIHTNLKRKGSTALTAITGAFTETTPSEPVDATGILIGQATPEPGTLETPDKTIPTPGPFDESCFDTCQLAPDFADDEPLTIRVLLQPGTTLSITTITYTIHTP